MRQGNRFFTKEEGKEQVTPGGVISERHGGWAAHGLVPKSPARVARVGGTCVLVPYICAWDTVGGNALFLS